jgi:hypothetical protein
MSGMRLSDAELRNLLRAHVPAGDRGLRAAIHADVESTRQQRPVPGLLGALVDADPRVRRRALLLAATLLLAVGAAVAGLAGAFVDRREPDPVVDLSVKPPADLPVFVRGAYSAMPRLQPMTITTLEDGTIKGRIYVDRSGAVRIEHFASLAANVPETYTIFAGDSMGQLLKVDGRPAWHEQSGAISEDPRVFVFAELGKARFSTGKEYGCEVAISPEEKYAYTPGEAWRWVGLETVAGRSAHHVTCAGVTDLWLDVETQLALRSQGPRPGPGGWPIAGEIHTIEVTAIDPGAPSPSLFELRPPDGVRVLSEAEYEGQQCIESGFCGGSPRPVISPPPAPGEKPLTGAAELVRLAEGAPDGVGAYAASLEDTTTMGPAQTSRTRVLFDGTGRYRIEATSQVGTVWEATSVTLIGPGYRYDSELQIDGTTIWRKSSRQSLGAYPLQVAMTCHGGWENRGVDLIAGRVADHVGCVGENTGDFWIDRASRLVVRTQISDDPSGGTNVREVVDLRIGPLQAVEWSLPVGAVVE